MSDELTLHAPAPTPAGVVVGCAARDLAGNVRSFGTYRSAG